MAMGCTNKRNIVAVDSTEVGTRLFAMNNSTERSKLIDRHEHGSATIRKALEAKEATMTSNTGRNLLSAF
jgi:hypothetical protein